MAPLKGPPHERGHIARAERRPLPKQILSHAPDALEYARTAEPGEPEFHLQSPLHAVAHGPALGESFAGHGHTRINRPRPRGGEPGAAKIGLAGAARLQYLARYVQS